MKMYKFICVPNQLTEDKFVNLVCECFLVLGSHRPKWNSITTVSKRKNLRTGIQNNPIKFKFVLFSLTPGA